MRIMLLAFILASVTAGATGTHKNLDLLFVIDNSGSMQTAQQRTCERSASLISKLNHHRINYRIGVITTDSWKGRFDLSQRPSARLRDGSGSYHSGVFVITPKTPQADRVLAMNLSQGTYGSGDERAFESIQQALTFEGNQDFRRPNVPLAIVILSDEDDFSTNSPEYGNEDYANPLLIPVGEYYAQFKTIAPKLSLSTISVQADDCLNEHRAGAANISYRYNALAEATGGIRTSICELDLSLEKITRRLIHFANGNW